jgi:serine protease
MPRGHAKRINNAGAVVMVAAGNSNTNVSNFTPADCNGVITVAAIGRTGFKASYSNYGSLVKISAPGGDTTVPNDPGVLSTLNSGTTVPLADSYAYYEGTSMATPHITGVVSLLFSVGPSRTPAQALSILQSTARAFLSGSSCTISICGSGSGCCQNSCGRLESESVRIDCQQDRQRHGHQQHGRNQL